MIDSGLFAMKKRLKIFKYYLNFARKYPRLKFEFKLPQLT